MESKCVLRLSFQVGRLLCWTSFPEANGKLPARRVAAPHGGRARFERLPDRLRMSKFLMKGNLMKLNSLPLVLLALAFATPVFAVDKYASTTGSDNNGGTLGSPYRTVAKGLQNVGAGDTLYLCAGACDGSGSGVFQEQVHSQQQTVPNGTDWTPGSGAVVVKAYPRETVTVAAGVTLINVQYHIWDGINIDHAVANPAPSQFTQCLYLAGGHHIRYQNAELKNCKWSGINTSDYTEWGHDWQFLNLNIHNTGAACPCPSAPSHGIYLSGGHQQSGVDQNTNIIIDGSDIHDNTADSNGWGIVVYTGVLNTVRGVTIRNNRIHNNSAGIGIFTGGDQALIYNNLIYKITWLSGVDVSTGGSKVYNNT